MRSVARTFSAGLSIRLPFTSTRPAAMIASASRREASPARARTLAIRSPEAAAFGAAFGADFGAGSRRGGRGMDGTGLGGLAKAACLQASQAP
jgi:hypothetical protein